MAENSINNRGNIIPCFCGNIPRACHEINSNDDIVGSFLFCETCEVDTLDEGECIDPTLVGSIKFGNYPITTSTKCLYAKYSEKNFL